MSESVKRGTESFGPIANSARQRLRAAWNVGPSLGDLVGSASGSARAEVIRHLIELDLELREKAELPFSASNYLEHLPDDEDAVLAVLADFARTSHGLDVVSTGDGADVRDLDDDSHALHSWSAERFRVLKPHARGGLGEVSMAEDRELARQVAIKEILPRHQSDAVARRRFAAEAAITGGLEHPGVAPVYSLGQFADGRPFYAMRFIKGESLEQAIRRWHQQPNEQSDERAVQLLGLLNRFVAVCQTVAFAHSRGVIHRDIKPANVMLGDFGETLLVDWGLARKMSAPLEVPAEPQELADPRDTGHNQVLGTLEFMSPEQARGDQGAVGPASDVFSLGASLYMLLCGRPPYRDGSREALRASAKECRYATPRAINPHADVPPTLEAICLKAMAIEPDARYTSPQDLATDIERYLADEPVSVHVESLFARARRWSRKHPRTLAGALATVLVGFVSLGAGLAVVAGKNEVLAVHVKKAETREEMAIDAVKRFRDVVANNDVLKESPSLTGLRKSLLKEPLEFFKKLREELQNDNDTRPEALVRLASASHELGFLTNEIGDKQDALAAFAESRAVWERLAREDSSETEFQSNLASSHSNIGLLLMMTGKPDEALAEHVQALAIKERLATENSTFPEFLSDLAESYNNIGGVLRMTGKPDKALAAWEQALAIRERLARENPTVSEFQSNLAASHNNIGALLSGTGKPAEALAAYEQALAIRERQARDNPTVQAFQSSLAGSHINIGNLLGDTGKPNEALAAYEQALAIQERLANESPTVLEFQSRLAACHINIGLLLRESGRPEDVLAEYKQALAIEERLARENPTVPEFQSRIAAILNYIGALLSGTGKLDEALAEYKQALAIRERLARENPTVPEFQGSLAASHNNIGALLIGTGKPDEARAAYEKALAIQERLARENPTVTDYHNDLGGMLFNLALLDLNEKRYAQARDRLRQAIETQQMALAGNPLHPDYRQALEEDYINLARAAQGLNDTSLAAEASQGLKDLQASDPRLAALDERLSAVIGGANAQDNAERLALAERAYDTRLFAAAARLWKEALASDPALIEDRGAQHAYNAACAAGLAGCGQGADDPVPDDNEKAILRAQALAWLQADLDAWNGLVDTATPEQRNAIAQILTHWQSDPDLAGLRGDAIETLPEEEREPCRALWHRVATLLNLVQSKHA